MKKIALVLAGLLFLGGVAANAQGFIIKAGYNYANVSMDKSVTVSDIIRGRSGFQAGVGYQTSVGSGFSFQPEVLFKVTRYDIADENNVAGILRVPTIEVPLNVQWGPDLWVARPFIFAGPYFGFNLKPTVEPKDKNNPVFINTSSLNAVEFGLGVGLGLNVFKFQIAAKYNWNFGSIAKAKEVDYTTLAGKPRTFEISVGFRF